MARALDLHSRGQGFDSLILHRKTPPGLPPTGGEEEERKRIKSWNKVSHTKKANVQKKIEILNFSKSSGLTARGLRL